MFIIYLVNIYKRKLKKKKERWITIIKLNNHKTHRIILISHNLKTGNRIYNLHDLWCTSQVLCNILNKIRWDTAHHHSHMVVLKTWIGTQVSDLVDLVVIQWCREDRLNKINTICRNKTYVAHLQWCWINQAFSHNHLLANIGLFLNLL